jgi:hypothetical protein
MSFSKFMQHRTSAGRKAVSNLTQNKESGAPKRDSLIISTPLKDGEGDMVVRFLPNKPAGASATDDVDAYGAQGTAWFEKRYQHNFELHGMRVIYDCPTSLDREQIKAVDSAIRLDIQNTSSTDAELAAQYGLEEYLVNRIRHDGQCPICVQNREWWNSGQEDIVKGFGGTKRNPHYFAWVLVKEVNGNTAHEWCDGKPRILHFKKQIFDILDKELNGVRKKEGNANANRRTKEVPTSLFYEMIDPVDENGNAVSCEGRDFLISAVKEKNFTTYKSEDEPSEFFGDAYPVATNDEEYEAIISAIQPLQDYILNNHKFNTYEEIEARLNKAIGIDGNDSADVDLDSGEAEESSVREQLQREVDSSELEDKVDTTEKVEETETPKRVRKSRKDAFAGMDL